MSQYLFDALHNANYPVWNGYELHNGEVILEIAVTGFKQDELTVTVEGDTLEISGQKAGEKVEVARWFNRSLAYRNFRKQIGIKGYELTENGVSLFDGVLRIALQKVDKRQKVAINVGRASEQVKKSCCNEDPCGK